MTKRIWLSALAGVIGMAAFAPSASAQWTAPYNTHGLTPGPVLTPLADNYIYWPLPPGGEKYGRIVGADLKQYVNELAAISTRYRDAGNPQFWGRIKGTSGDAETAEWLMNQFRRIGLDDVRAQPFELPPLTLPDRWSVEVVSRSGEAVELVSAIPGDETVADLRAFEAEIVSVGLGEPLDFRGRDVAGKIVLIHGTPEPSAFIMSAVMVDALERAEKAGAAATIVTLDLPGNISGFPEFLSQKIPVFVIGRQDGDRVRATIEGDVEGGTTMRLSLSSKTIDKPSTALIWGVLPGATDETIYVMAHRDGYFEAAMDNGSGMATMLGLAEFYAAVPREQRRRTMVFVGTPGHHDQEWTGVRWMAQNAPTIFGKTALLINAEHTSFTTMTSQSGTARLSNGLPAFNWWAGGGTPKFQRIAVDAFRDYGVATNESMDSGSYGEAGPFRTLAPIVQVISGSWIYHTTADTPANVPANGLEATTRAYARIIDGVNELPLADIVPPRPSATSAKP